MDKIALAHDADELALTGAALIRRSRKSRATSLTVVVALTVITGEVMTSCALIIVSLLSAPGVEEIWLNAATDRSVVSNIADG